MSQQVDLQPTLHGERVTVRPIRPDDWDSLYSAASDPEIWVLHPARDRYKAEVFRAYFDDAVASGSAFVFVDRASEKLMGSSRFYGFDRVASEIEIGWTFLAREYWGGSYNAEIKKLLVEHAFGFVDAVIFWVGADNLRSRRAVEKIGAKLRDGTFRRDVSGADEHVVYELRKPERIAAC